MNENTEQPFLRYRDIIDDYDAFCESLKQPLPVTLWHNPDRIGVSELKEMLESDGYSPTPLDWYPAAMKLPENQRLGKHWGFFAGLFQLQEESAMLPTRVLGAKPGETVLDMCAAPGNKAAQLAFDMQNTGTLYANEMNRRRVASLKETCERLGLRNVAIMNQNGTNLPKNSARFDRILVDAPCSCEGTTRKHPELPLQSDVETSLGLQGVQAALLRKAVQLCKPGGRIVYSTCTYAPEENECILMQILDEFPDELSLLPIDTYGLKHSQGLTEWDGQAFSEEFKNCVRIWPHQNDCGGFFVASLQKAVDSVTSEVSDGCSQASTAECDEWVFQVVERYGLESSLVNPLAVFKGNSKETRCVSNDFKLYEKLKPERYGLHIFNHKKTPVKLSHSGALLLGANATRNVIDLTESQVYEFMKREKVLYDSVQLIHWDRESELLVKCNDTCIGIGHLQQDDNGQSILCSHFPKNSAKYLNTLLFSS